MRTQLSRLARVSEQQAEVNRQRDEECTSGWIARNPFVSVLKATGGAVAINRYFVLTIKKHHVHPVATGRDQTLTSD